MIRTATVDDLAALRRISQDNQAGYLADHLDRQKRGLGELIVARLNGYVVGNLYLWLDRADEPEIRQYLPGVPLLQHAWVTPPLRDRGIGTALLTTAEDRLRAGGHRRVALAVERTNHDAARLYHRLGYHDWAHGPVRCDRWPATPTDAPVVESCAVLVKPLIDTP
jgi:GNAT superfamily N-acetyltransferase